MNTLREISVALRRSVSHRAIKQSDLKTLAGISQRTLTNVLSGNEDYKVSTLLALAVEAGQTSQPRVKSRVAAALDRVRGASSEPDIKR